MVVRSVEGSVLVRFGGLEEPQHVCKGCAEEYNLVDIEGSPRQPKGSRKNRQFYDIFLSDEEIDLFKRSFPEIPLFRSVSDVYHDKEA
jgi:hypothetical protein